MSVDLNSFPDGFRVAVHGAGRGIGLAFVEALLECPTVGHVLATCRRPSESAELQAALARQPQRLSALAMDATCEATVEAAATEVGRSDSKLSLVINSFGVLHDAGGMKPEKRLEDVALDTLVRSFSVNAAGPLLVAKHFAPLLASPERCVFASLSARVGSIGDNRLGGWYAYRVSKAAQNMMTRTLSIELARRRPGSICVGLHPGTTDTDLSAPFTGRVAADKLFSPQRAAQQLLAVIDSLTEENNGSFLAWDGSPIPW